MPELLRQALLFIQKVSLQIMSLGGDMSRKQSGLLLAVHQGIDLIIVALCFYLAYRTKSALPDGLNGFDHVNSYNALLFMALGSFQMSFRLFAAYAQYRKITLQTVISTTFKATLTGTAGIIFLCYLLHVDAVSRLFIAIFSVYTLFALILFKGTLYNVLTYTRSRNFNTRNILVIGTQQRRLTSSKL